MALCHNAAYTSRSMENANCPPSRLLLRLALAFADLKTAGSFQRRSPSELPDDGAEGEGKASKPEEQGQLAGGKQTDNLSEAAWERLESLRHRFQEELSFADSWLAEDPPSSRVQFLLANSSELRKVALLQRLLQRAYTFRFNEPQEGLRISDEIGAWTESDPSPLVAVIRSRALIERGNFLRILGDSARAYESLAGATRELEANTTCDPLEVARYQEVLGTLERDCGNFEAAAELLRKALAKVRRWGDPHALQRVLMAAALNDLYRNRFEGADALLDESLKTAKPNSLFLKFTAVNKVLVQQFSGNPHNAYRALLGISASCGPHWLREFPENNRMHVLWSEGSILNALRIDDKAVARLKQARDFFIRTAQGAKVGHVSIELALSYAAQRRFSEVRRELEIGLLFCSDEGAHDRHAREALLLLQRDLKHRGRLETERIRTVNHRLDCLQRAPLQAARQQLSADLF